MTDTVQFNSCGDVCKGVLTRPGGKSDNVPLVIMAGGWCYTKEIVMPWYGKFFEDLDDRFHETDHGTGNLLADSSFVVDRTRSASWQDGGKRSRWR